VNTSTRKRLNAASRSTCTRGRKDIAEGGRGSFSEDLPDELAKLAAEAGSIAVLARKLNFDRKNLHKVVRGQRASSGTAC
jgi:hypothetical protein